jgi:NAD(P)-dependent dehydrogenase (short-subunit alcohol dehydrogenase family)
MKLLDGTVAVVTGGGKGIGAAIARRLLAGGARVVVAGRDQAALGRIDGAVPIACDVTRPAHVARLVDETHRRLGPATMLVNNAGIARSAKLADTDEDLWRETLDVNLTGAYRVTRAFLGDIVAAGRGGRIVNVASVAARVGFPYTTAYCASKHGLLGFTRALALELAGAAEGGPTVNCVCPGWVDTEMSGQAIANIARATGRSEEDARRSLERMSPQRRLMTAEEVAEVVGFLAAPHAWAVTGQAWNVDGGEVMS